MNSPHDANTVFMTEQEADRIRNTFKKREEKCSELAGRTREPRDPRAAISEATGASLMADMGAPDTDLAQTRGRGGRLPALAVGKPYPPCATPLRSLRPMTLADLRMETHHRGYRLDLKRASPVVTLTSRSWTTVQDDGGDEGDGGDVGDETERLELCLHTSKHGEDILESATYFAIKEPYFTLTNQGEATLRVDHPSDLVVRGGKETDGALGSTSRTEGRIEDAAAAGDIARALKDRGNAALERQNLPLAHAMYTEGIGVAGRDAASAADPDLARDLYRNRAHVNLLLGHADEAKLDARAALVGKEDRRSKDLDSKAYFRAGRAAYDLGEYQEAKGFFDEQRKLAPGSASASAYLRKVETRLREQETGRYNLEKIKAGLSTSRPRADAASFVADTKIGESPGRGRGLFATRNLAAGDLVMCEKAFCVVWGHEDEALSAATYDLRDDTIRASPAGLIRSTVRKLLGNRSQIERIMDLHGDYRGDGDDAFASEDGPLVDTFRVHDVVSRNAFGPGSGYHKEGEQRYASAGLWVRAAYINHSCVANVEREYVGDMMVLRASRPIRSGEEIFHRYDGSSGYEARQRALKTTWGFRCGCAVCAAEKKNDVS
ncbi:hypothetical protein F4781DRAFT_152782 [Annulohypoxylon bovei var. microspora]|nr:hypothetical protein F4781DRAFT_152782 [Annulohypoxylon bovei var. microspora]